MSKLTRKKAELLATAMVNNPDKVYQLRQNGNFVVLNGGGEVTLYQFDPQTNEPNNQEIVWQQSVNNLAKQDPRFKYKTHMTDYLYQTLTPNIEKLHRRGLTGKPEIDYILLSEKYKNYLKNPPLEIERYVNTEDYFELSSGSTGFGRHTKEKLYTYDELVELHEKARVLAVNDKRAKIKKPYTYKRYIEENYNDYELAYQAYEKDFAYLRELWNWKMSGDGLRYGTSEDDIYRKIILPVEFRLQRKSYNGDALRRVRDMVRNLNRVIETAEDKDSGIISYTATL